MIPHSPPLCNTTKFKGERRGFRWAVQFSPVLRPAGHGGQIATKFRRAKRLNQPPPSKFLGRLRDICEVQQAYTYHQTTHTGAYRSPAYGSQYRFGKTMNRISDNFEVGAYDKSEGKNFSVKSILQIARLCYNEKRNNCLE